MRNIFSLLLLAVFMFSVQGCWSDDPKPPKTRIIVRENYHIIVPPETMLSDLPTSRPPSRELMHQADCSEKVTLLGTYVIKLLGDNEKEQDRINRLREWYKLQLILHKDHSIDKPLEEE